MSEAVTKAQLWAEWQRLANDLVRTENIRATDKWELLPGDEKARLVRQVTYMKLYKVVLEERIEALPE